MAELTAEQRPFASTQVGAGLVGGANPQLFNLPVGVTTPGG